MSDDTVHANTFGGGYRQDPFDAKDHYYKAPPGLQTPGSIDLRESAAEFMIPVYNQGHIGSCVANATSAAFWFEEKRAKQQWTKDGPSRLFLYWLARGGDSSTHTFNSPSDSGCIIRDAMMSLYRIGTCPELDWPYVENKVNLQPPESAYKDASPHKINQFFRLDPDRPDADNHTLNDAQKKTLGETLLSNLKCCLTEGYPVAFGFWYYMKEDQMWSTDAPFVLNEPWTHGFPPNTFPGDLPSNLRFFKDGKGNPITPGHAVLAVGYDDSKTYGNPNGEKGAVLVQNSWGSRWSGDGYFWMPYSWIRDFAATNDFWTIRITTNGAGKLTAAPPQPPLLWQDVHQSIFGQ